MLILFLGTILVMPDTLFLLAIFLILVIPFQLIRVYLLKINAVKAKVIFLISFILLLLTCLEVYFERDPYDRVKISHAQNDIKIIVMSLDLFRTDNHSYPTTKEDLNSLVDNPNISKYNNWRQYIKKVPLDPWGNKYKYLFPGVRSNFDIYSFGPDGVLSSDDIGNWDL